MIAWEYSLFVYVLVPSSHFSSFGLWFFPFRPFCSNIFPREVISKPQRFHLFGIYLQLFILLPSIPCSLSQTKKKTCNNHRSTVVCSNTSLLPCYTKIWCLAIHFARWTTKCCCASHPNYSFSTYRFTLLVKG